MAKLLLLWDQKTLEGLGALERRGCDSNQSAAISTLQLYRQQAQSWIENICELAGLRLRRLQFVAVGQPAVRATPLT
jgi:hypothetical protein